MQLRKAAKRGAPDSSSCIEESVQLSGGARRFWSKPCRNRQTFRNTYLTPYFNSVIGRIGRAPPPDINDR